MRYSQTLRWYMSANSRPYQDQRQGSGRATESSQLYFVGYNSTMGPDAPILKREGVTDGELTGEAMVVEAAVLAVDVPMNEFKEFCSDVFATLGRTDQRQAAETYLYGLLNCSGRKSIRRLVATAPGRSEQSLQQFINQSPWDPEPIRQRLLTHLTGQLRPTAWVIEKVPFPKHGHYS